jgi:hypothetical protein
MRHVLLARAGTGMNMEATEVAEEIARALDRSTLGPWLERRFARHPGYDIQVSTPAGAAVFHRWAQNRQIRAFVDGVTAAATGAIAGAALVLGRRAIIDLFTAALALGTWWLLTHFRKVPEPVVILVAGLLAMAAAPVRS